jgi:hypothetical protein
VAEATLHVTVSKATATGPGVTHTRSIDDVQNPRSRGLIAIRKERRVGGYLQLQPAIPPAAAQGVGLRGLDGYGPSRRAAGTPIVAAVIGME